MNIQQFSEKYFNNKDSDKIFIKCDHELHVNNDLIEIGKQPAKRNILKNNGEKFICRNCYMKHNNPMNHLGNSRQTDELIEVICTHPSHVGNNSRIIKKSCYYGNMQTPYEQICGSCSQRDKIIKEETKVKISESLTGIKRTDEFKQKLSNYMKNHPEGISRGKENLIPGSGGGWNKGSHLSDETKQKMSEAHSGKTFTPEHCEKISIGRLKMLEETGGFTKEHIQKLREATIRNYQNGFDPKNHHITGWHSSPKAGNIFFRSSYEKKAYLILDDDLDVKTYKAESLTIEYLNPTSNTIDTYLVDLEIERMDGSIEFIEVKPSVFVNDAIVLAKTSAALAKNINFKIWTEIDLFGVVYNEKNIKEFVNSLRENPDKFEEIKKEKNREKAKRYYDNKIATQKIKVYCSFCEKEHEILQNSYNKNIERNGRFICIKENGHIIGSKSKLKEANLFKQCNGECKQLLSLDCFSKGKAMCKKCRSKIAKNKYNEKKNIT